MELVWFGGCFYSSFFFGGGGGSKEQHDRVDHYIAKAPRGLDLETNLK